MRCPACHFSDTTCVINTVPRRDGTIRRRHGCERCQIRWTSSEEITPGSLTSAVVRKSSGDQDSTGTS